MMRRGHVCLAKIAGCLGVVICLVGAHEVLHFCGGYFVGTFDNRDK